MRPTHDPNDSSLSHIFLGLYIPRVEPRSCLLHKAFPGPCRPQPFLLCLTQRTRCLCLFSDLNHVTLWFLIRGFYWLCTWPMVDLSVRLISIGNWTRFISHSTHLPLVPGAGCCARRSWSTRVEPAREQLTARPVSPPPLDWILLFSWWVLLPWLP